MDETHDDRLPAVRAAEAYLPEDPADGEGGALDRASRAGRRVVGPFQRPQHAIDRVLLAAIEESNQEARRGLDLHSEQTAERLAALTARVEDAELECARLARELADRELRHAERVEALEASLALLATRLDARDAEGNPGERQRPAS